MTTSLDERVDLDQVAPPPVPEIDRKSRGRLYRFLTRNRRPIVWLHRWLSIVLLAFIVIESATGAALVFAPEIDRLVNRSDYAATAGDRGISAAIAAAREARPDEPVDSVLPPGDGRPVYIVFTVDRGGTFHQVLVDPGSARVLDRDHAEPAAMLLLERLHFNINSTSVFGFAPLTIMAWLSIGWLLSMLSGFYVWFWPRVKRWRHALRVRARRGWFTFNLDLHNAIGVVTIVPLILLAITGINFAFPSQVASAWDAITFGQYAEPDTSVSTSQPGGGEPIGPERAAEIVERLDPAVDVSSVDLPGGSPIGVYGVLATVDGSYLGLVGGAHEVEFDVDQYSGAVVAIHDPLDDNGATRAYAQWADRVHFGDFGGTPSRVAWVAVGIAPVVLGVTGVVMYVIRLRRRRSRLPEPEAEVIG